jgi:glucose/arabinose dehydrogenase
MAFGPDGRLYVTESGGLLVVAQPGSTRPTQMIKGLRSPLGLVWVAEDLFVSEQGRVEKFANLASEGGARSTVLGGLPYGEHQQDNIVLGPDGRLYLGSGSTCDDCKQTDTRSAAILSFLPDGSDLRVVAPGVRNPFGLAFSADGTLYATVNGQDDLDRPGDPEPADMVVRVSQGANYGWPGCWPSARQLSMVGRCSGVSQPAVYLGPHASADGLAFYEGASFPSGFTGNLFVAQWGQYFGTANPGRNVVRIQLSADGTAPISGVSVFATGFLHPLACLVDPYGALLVADWGTGNIIRIQASTSP